ncbi:MAG: helix-turn-helix domain-containing protein [Bacteroidota bacterium]
MAELHIGEAIKDIFESKGMTISEFSRRLNNSRENVYSIFKRKSIDTALLYKISMVLDYNFFELFQFENKRNLAQELEECKNETIMLKEYIQVLKAKAE